MAERAAAVKNLIVQAQKQDASGDEQVKEARKLFFFCWWGEVAGRDASSELFYRPFYRNIAIGCLQTLPLVRASDISVTSFRFAWLARYVVQAHDSLSRNVRIICRRIVATENKAAVPDGQTVFRQVRVYIRICTDGSRRGTEAEGHIHTQLHGDPPDTCTASSCCMDW